MEKLRDLSKHHSISHAGLIDQLLKPFNHLIELKHFRYLKLFSDGSRVLLSNHTDCIRYMYESNRFQSMWFDGEYNEHLAEGWHYWSQKRLLDSSKQASSLEYEINTLLGLSHGMTFVTQSQNAYEIFSFDTNSPALYEIEKTLFLRFILYFKQTARTLIQAGEQEKLIVPINNLSLLKASYHDRKDLSHFLEATKINRYYLSGLYEGIYLTAKEAQCAYWLTQGKSAEEIAVIEGMKTKTVQCHLENIRRKLNCYKQTQLVAIIINSGILQADPKLKP